MKKTLFLLWACSLFALASHAQIKEDKLEVESLTAYPSPYKFMLVSKFHQLSIRFDKKGLAYAVDMETGAQFSFKGSTLLCSKGEFSVINGRVKATKYAGNGWSIQPAAEAPYVYFFAYSYGKCLTVGKANRHGFFELNLETQKRSNNADQLWKIVRTK